MYEDIFKTGSSTVTCIVKLGIIQESMNWTISRLEKKF
jgi:hypothetical protein